MQANTKIKTSSREATTQSNTAEKSPLPTSLKINELATLTGFDRKTIAERLTAAGLPFVDGERNSKIFVVKDALKVIYQSSGVTKDVTKLDAEKLRQLTAKATLAEIDLAEKQQKLIPIEDILTIVNEEYTVVRNTLTQIPSALAIKLSVETDSRVIADLIDSEVQSALAGLKLSSEEALKSYITQNNPETPDDNE